MVYRCLSVLGIVTFLAAGSLRAATVEVTFEGRVDGGVGEIPRGSTFSGKIVYDNTVSETPGCAPGACFDAGSALEVTYTNPNGDAFTFTANAARILVDNDVEVPPMDDLGFTNLPLGALNGPPIMGLVPREVFISLIGGDAGLFPSLNLADLPTSYSLSDFALGGFTLQGFDASDVAEDASIVGTLTKLEARLVVVDSDGDGIADDQDACPSSDLRPTVVIGSCDTRVENVLLPNGCTIVDRIAEIRSDARTKGQFLVRVARLGAVLVRMGVLDWKDLVALVRCAAHVRI